MRLVLVVFLALLVPREFLDQLDLVADSELPSSKRSSNLDQRDPPRPLPLPPPPTSPSTKCRRSSATT